MATFKKYTSSILSFVLGIIITYLVMNLEMMKLKLQQSSEVTEKDAEIRYLKKQLNPESDQEEEHWLDERIQKEAAESEERTKQQQSQGDKLKSQFDEFVE